MDGRTSVLCGRALGVLRSLLAYYCRVDLTDLVAQGGGTTRRVPHAHRLTSPNQSRRTVRPRAPRAAGARLRNSFCAALAHGSQTEWSFEASSLSTGGHLRMAPPEGRALDHSPRAVVEAATIRPSEVHASEGRGAGVWFRKSLERKGLSV
jgi:hypothetical protein